MSTDKIFKGEEYRSHFDPKAYLHACYPPEMPISRSKPLQYLYEFYSDHKHSCPSREFSVLDLGCGPVVAYVISAAQFVSEIVLAEYSDRNRQEFCDNLLKIGTGNIDHEWTHVFEYVVTKVEGKSTTEIIERERKVKSVIKDVVPCDITKDPVMNPEYMKEYDVVQCILCLEAACSDREMYVSGLKRIWSLTKPGGTFILYTVNRNHSSVPASYEVGGLHFHDVRVTLEFVLASLIQVGFSIVKTIPIFYFVDDDSEKTCSFNLVFATKFAAPLHETDRSS